MEAIRHLQIDVSVIDTGNFRNDLAAILKGVYQSFVAHPYPFLGKLVLKLIGEYQANPAIFQPTLTQLILPRFQRFFSMVEQAQARQEIRADIDPQLVMELVAGPLYFHALVMGHLTPARSAAMADWTEQVIDAIMQGIGRK